jgi:ribonuclease HI
MCGFCDASVAAHDDGRAAGVGSIILDASGRTVARISRRSADCEPFEAEIAALEATLDMAAGLGEGARRIRVYTDCDALVALWLQRRSDPRLRGVRALARGLRAFQLCRLPRRHNQAAHRLARDGALH